MATAESTAPKPRFGMLRIIAVYKLLKVVLLVLVAYGELRLHDATLSAKLLSWLAARPSGMEHDIVKKVVVWFSGLSDSRIHALRAVTLSYAVLFAVEGIGLWMRRRWAEWLTTIITASLMPFELWELIRHPTIGAAAVLIANGIIVGYLYWHVSTRHTRT
jgi:uncharacterized membrane protein (DUF2068 family)